MCANAFIVPDSKAATSRLGVNLFYKLFKSVKCYFQKTFESPSAYRLALSCETECSGRHDRDTSTQDPGAGR